MEESQVSEIFTEKPVVYASFGERLIAVILDCLVLLTLNTLVTYLITGSMWGTPEDYTSTIAGLVIGWLYDALQESGPAQATLGKRAMNIKVTDLSANRISFMQATGRHFGKYVSFIIILIGYFMMLWTPKKQTLHDIMASTLVLKH